MDVATICFIGDNMNEKISVIVPVYNAQSFLDRCVESITAQSYKNIEIILVDDGSTDGSPQMCDKWAECDERIKVIHCQNSGVACARNTGIAAAAGEYISFVDSDDWLEADALEYLYSLVNSGGCDIACCSYELSYDGKSNIVNPNEQVNCRSFEECVRRLYDDSLWSICAKLYKKELFNKIPEIEVKLTVSEDLLLNYYLFKSAGSAVISNQKKYNYFRHSGSAVGRGINPKRIEDSMTAYQIIYDDFDKSSPAFSYQAANKISNDFMLLNCIIKEKSCREYYSVLRKDILKDFKYIFKAENSYCFAARHKIGAVLLAVFPRLYDLMIIAREKA